MSSRSKKGRESRAASRTDSSGEKETSSSTTTTTKRTVIVESSGGEKVSTPQHRSKSPSRSYSPLSVTRCEEKDELSHLNERLAGYIDYVRSLEKTKEQLTRRIQTYSESSQVEVTNIKKLYEDEVTSLRRALDEVSKENAGLNVELKKARNDYDDMKGKLGKRDSEVRTLQRRLEQMEKDLAQFKLDHDRYVALKADYDALEKQYETTRKQLEQETLLRTDLENRVQTLKEQLAFQESLFEQERSKLMMKTVTIEEEVEGRKAAEYESKLADELRALREETAEELEQYRIDIEETFKTKFNELKSTSDRYSSDVMKTREELMLVRKSADSLGQELAAKSAEIDILRKRVGDLESLLQQERSDYEAQLVMYREESEHLKAELQEKFREFNDLMNTKIMLDQELMIYRKMIEGEEGRLHLSPPTRESSFSARSAKRRRTDDVDSSFGGASSSQSSYKISASCKGDIELASVDATGRFVKITNKASKEVCLGGWQLKHAADGKETTYKFHRSLHIKPATECTIWSSDANETHNPPSDLVMKGQRFFTGGLMKTTLTDGDGNEVAVICMERQKRTTTYAARGKHDDKCSLM